MRLWATISFLAVSVAWGDFTSPPWPSGTNYHTAGTNKDWRAAQVREAVVEREQVLLITNSPQTAPVYYTSERANCVAFKDWVRENCTAFVDQVHSTTSSVYMWTWTGLLANASMPTNYGEYTPWQALNGVGHAITNEHTAAGYSTLDYGYAGLTNLFKRLTHVKRVGAWSHADGLSYWGHGWWDAGGGDGTRIETAGADPATMYHSSYTSAVAESLAFIAGDVVRTNVPPCWDLWYVDPADAQLEEGTSVAPMEETFIGITTNDFSVPSYYATWRAVVARATATNRASSAAAKWTLYLSADTAHDLSPSSRGGSIMQRDDYGLGFGQAAPVAWSTGSVAAASVIYSAEIGPVDGMADAAHFPTNAASSEWNSGVWQGNVDECELLESINYIDQGGRGYYVNGWFFILNYGESGGFSRK